MPIKTKVLAAAIAVAIAGTASWGAGLWQTLPIIGGAAYCGGTNISGPVQSGITGQGGNAAANGATTGGVICQNNVPAGPPTLTGTEVLPIDLYMPGTQVSAGGPSTAVIPATSLANGFGTATFTTTTGTGQNPVVADGVSYLIYAGSSTATFATLTLPPNPVNNQKFCVVNDGSSGALTVTLVQVGTSGQSIVQGVAAPFTVSQQVATGAAGSTTNSSLCYLYRVSNTSWYRVS